jgi:thiamine biosynthesis lipoprotein
MKRLLLVIMLSLLLAACQKQAEQPVNRTRLLMGTVVEITAFGPEAATGEAVERAFAELSRVERLMSPHLEQSDLSRLTRAPQGAELSLETIGLLQRSLELNRISSGAFDPTLGQLKQLWGVEGDQPHLPSAAEIAAVLQQTGPQRLTIEGLRVTKSAPGLAIDLGGIAKGYAIDRAADLLRQAGVTQASINAGGDLRLLGDRQGRPWRIGIQHPRKPGELLAVLSLTDRAVVTSGDYERFFEIDGVRYHHIFDPATGRPATACQSVTIVAADATLADALATAAFILGPETGRELLESQGAEGILVGADGQVLTTAGLKGQIEWR